MKYFLKICVGLAFLLFAGCATTVPTADEMKEDIAGYELPHKPEEGKSLVYVVRPSTFGGLVRFKVYVDGKEEVSNVGYTRGGQYIYFNVEPGEHHIYSRAENWAELFVETTEGSITFLQQRASMGVLFARNSLEFLPSYHGTYEVKRLKPGTLSDDEVEEDIDS